MVPNVLSKCANSQCRVFNDNIVSFECLYQYVWLPNDPMKNQPIQWEKHNQVKSKLNEIIDYNK